MRQNGMQTRHVPKIDRRYWVGILFASIFGTNSGDLYAHESGLGLGPGLAGLAGLFAAVYLIERKDGARHEVWYWLAIVIIRTGATNIADFLAFRVRIPALLLAAGLAAVIALLAWGASAQARADDRDRPALGATNLIWWAAMLGAGVFGTAVGDDCSHLVGQGPASVGLLVMLAALLAVLGSRAATRVAPYWCAVALARTAGTCVGDWFAEGKSLHVGLPLSTLLTGTMFVAILAFWRSTQQDARAAA
jgi:uncharacterized membrane-anchored protein